MAAMPLLDSVDVTMAEQVAKGLEHEVTHGNHRLPTAQDLAFVRYGGT